MASHYKTAIIPARPYKPKDKAKAENGVLVVERWIMARLRNQTFFSLAELNQAIRHLLVDLNRRPFKKLPGCRQSQFEQLDKPAMRALPPTRYVYTQFKLARVNVDYHIEFDKHFYSVPHHLVSRQVEIQATRDGVAVFFKGEQVARHPRKGRNGGFTTSPSHMPQRHRQQQKWTPGRLLNWAQEIGPNVVTLVETWLKTKDHPEQAYRASLGLLNLSRRYDAQRLDRACQRAIEIGSPKLRSVNSILKQGLDQLALKLEEADTAPLTDHDNIRGPQYYN